NRRVRLRRGAGTLDPLALEVLRNRGAEDSAGAGVLNLDPGARDGGLWVEEGDSLLVSRPRPAPLDTSRHHGFPVRIQISHGFQGENVRVGVLEVASDCQLSCRHDTPLWNGAEVVVPRIFVASAGGAGANAPRQSQIPRSGALAVQELHALSSQKITLSDPGGFRGNIGGAARIISPRAEKGRGPPSRPGGVGPGPRGTPTP